MHVLFDGRLLHHSLSGLQRCQRNLLRELSRRPEITRLSVLVEEGHPLPQPWPEQAVAVPEISAQEVLRLLLHELPEERPDVYHITWFPTERPQELLLALAANATVVEVHDAILNRHPEYHPDDERWSWYDQFVKTLVRSCDRILVHSNSVRDELERDLDGDRSISDLAPLAVDPALREPLPEAELSEHLRHLGVEGDYFLLVGKDFPHKDHATAFQAIARTSGHANLICAGDHAWTRLGAETSAAAEESGVGDRVRWIEGLDDLRLKALLCGARALVYPSREEGFGIPPLEAMALGIPVVAASAMSIPEVCRDAAWYFEPGDADQLATQLDRVLAGGPALEELIARGRAHESSYSWERTAEATLDCYQKALQAARSGCGPRQALPDGIRASLSILASAPFDDRRELVSWQRRCLAREKELEERELWIAALLEELRGRRWRVSPRKLREEEELFLARLRGRPQSSR